MKRAVKPLRFAAFAVKTEISDGLMPRIRRALRIVLAAGAPAAKCLALVLGMSQCGLAANVWYDVSGAPDRLWTTAAGWRYSGGALGRLPGQDDNVSIDSIQTGPDNPIVIPSGYDAQVRSLVIASISGNENNYASDGRIPSLTLYGTLQTPSNNKSATAITVGSAVGGFGLMRIEEGAVITNANVTIGYQGIGVVTNSRGSLYLSPYGENHLTVGAENPGIGTYVQNSGFLFARALHIGLHATGTVEVAGGVVTNTECSYVGVRSAEGRLVVRGGKFFGEVMCGYAGGGHGVLEMSGGSTLQGDTVIGGEGTGEFLFRGGRFAGRNLTLGSENGGYGNLDVNATDLLTVDNLFLCGHGGRGTATLRSNMQQEYLKIGGSLNNVSEMTILEGATNQVRSSAAVGGYPMPVYQGKVLVGTTEHAGGGILTLRGGTLHFYNTASSENFFLGQYADGWGCLRGYGKIAPKTTGATNIRLGGGNCIICADGEGVERALDLNECVGITNYFAEVNVATSTNGWYAVNKGRVRFPRAWFGTASAERCIGDSPYAARPRFVNSVRCSFTGVSGSNSFFRGGLYATDCESIPAGLPSGDVIGVWAFGLFTAVNDDKKVSFSTALPTFRYDHTKVRAGRTLNLYRHNGTAWVRVGKTMSNDEHLISTDSALTPLSSGAMNIGFFAVVAPTPGMMVFVR